MKISLTRQAQLRLDEIMDYTSLNWGDEQAESYLQKMGKFIEQISEKRFLWRKPNVEKMKQVYFLRFEHHYIFFREDEHCLVILNILHENMDMVKRLKDSK